MKSRTLVSLSLLLIGATVLSLRSFGDEKPTDVSGLNARPTAEWVRNSVIYEVFPRQFSPTGDFAGITAKLDQLKALGVDIVWIMPIHPIGHLKAKGSIGSPYAVRDYYAVNPDYGTKDDFRKLVDSAHERGMKVIIDIVANHTSWDSVMMSHPSYYKQDAEGHVIPPHPEWLDVAGLNYKNPETRTYMREMLRYWVREFKLDGYRCDVAGDVPTDFWEDVRRDVEAIHPGFFMLAEASKPELLVNAFDSDYAWPMLATLSQVLMAGAPASDLQSTWETKEQATFPRGALHMRCSDDHDESRAIARFGIPASLAASALMFSLDGIPLIYNGMEVGDAAESSDPSLFEKVPIVWESKGREGFRATYTRLAALRHTLPALSGGNVVWVRNSASSDVVILLRHTAAQEVLTLVNLSNRPRTVSFSAEHSSEFVAVLGSRPNPKPLATEATLGAFEWTIYRRDLKP